MRRLVVNADDFGFTEGVNKGIVRARREGILRSTTLMANGRAFDHAARVAKENPELDVGVHGVLIQGRMVSDAERDLPPSTPAFLAARYRWLTPERIEAELRAQIEKILGAGLRPTHIDTHKHTHFDPGVLEAVLRLAAEYGIGWVRTPYEIPHLAATLRVPARSSLQWALRRTEKDFRARIAERGLRATDHFAGFALTGRLVKRSLLRLIDELPKGDTELMTHPGVNDATLQDCRTRLKQSRAQELAALTDPEVAEAIAAAGIELCSFADLD